MNPYLTQLQNKVNSTKMTEEEKEKYWEDFSTTVRAKMLDEIYAKATPANKQKLEKLTDNFDADTYFQVLEEELPDKNLVEKIQQNYIEMLQKEIAKFP